MTKKYKIIIDTNLWISFLLTKRFEFIDKMLNNGSIELVFCTELLREFIEVSNRPKLQKFFTNQELKLIFEIIERYSIIVSIKSCVTVCRDIKDNFLLSLSKDAQADYLITGDKDLLILKHFETTRILTISEFEIISKTL